jgi:hypothetical protein
VIELLVAASASSACWVRLSWDLRSNLSIGRETHPETREIVGLIGNMFVVVTSLVLGLMLNSAKTTFETNNNNVRAAGIGLWPRCSSQADFMLFAIWIRLHRACSEHPTFLFSARWRICRAD